MTANMDSLNNEYRSIIASLGGDPEGQELACGYMENSTAIYHDEVVDFLYMPKLFPASVVETFDEIASTTYSILSKVIKRYLADDAYRELFGFSAELEKLILTPSGYPSSLPIARIDLFLNENDLSFCFCEFNTDGTSAMNEDREICAALAKTPSYREMERHHSLSCFELFDTWVEQFARIYATYDRRVDDPLVAIVDFMESATSAEFSIFQERFTAYGFRTRICEIRDLTYENGNLLTPDGERIDAVYRRAVTSEIMDHLDEVPAFIEAVKDNAVCLIGAFQTQIVHCKTIFEILHREETLSFLTQDEREFVGLHVPFTAHLTAQAVNLDAVLDAKDEWIIKPKDGYAASGVYAGIDHSKKDWKALLEEKVDNGYVAQRYCRPYCTENLRPKRRDNSCPETDLGTTEFELFKNLTGLYIYNGKFKGIFSRAGQQGTICAAAGGVTLASIVVDAAFDNRRTK